MRFRLARWTLRYRGAVAMAFLAVTIAFAYAIPNVQIRTIFNDLLPRDDPFVQVFFDHRNFGNPLTMSIMVKVKQGDIYNAQTLAKVWDLTRGIDLAPGANHDQLVSITTEKLRYAIANAKGMDTKPLMRDWPPTTEAELAEFRRNVDRSVYAHSFFISGDETATLIKAGFHDSIDYGEAFEFAQRLVEEARDANHEVYLAGQPALTGWVYRLQKQTYLIFALTVLALMISLMFYMRNVAGIVTPIVCASVAGIWGFGFIAWLDRPIEPLLMIVPLLLVARSFSHCVQFIERYYEVCAHIPERRKAAEVTLGIMMAPSVLSILTDVFGIIFIAIAPIETMVNHAIFCGFWALWIIPTGTFLIAVLLSYLPKPKNLEQIVSGGSRSTGIHAVQRKLLLMISRIAVGTPARYTAAGVVLVTIWAFYANSQVEIGNPVEGSNVLWPDSEFNTAVRTINAHFPGMITLEIVLEGTGDIDGFHYRIARTPETVAVTNQLQRLLESDEQLPPRATLSFTDYMAETNRLLAGGNPKWQVIDPTLIATNAAGFGVTLGTSPINLLHVVDFSLRHSTVTAWYPDARQQTLDAALASARRAVAAVGEEHGEFKIRLATGSIALQQAMNSVVERYHWFILGLLNVAVLLISAFAYRSVIAGLMLLVPVNIANLMLGAAMHALGTGFDINAVIVAVMGVGIGIDYSIYLLSRICEEFSGDGDDHALAIANALTTTGKAIMFTATVMLIGILPWYFLTDLKFMADMGLLLVAIMLINMVLSLVVIPLLIWLIKPKFMARDDLLIGETVDLSQYSATSQAP
jgi:uncharacterized protein